MIEDDPVTKTLVRLIAGLTSVLLLAASLAFAQTATPLGQVKTTLNAVLAILHNQKAPLTERRRALLHLAESNLDLATMARGSLGNHWTELTSQQRADFVPLFGSFIEAAYLAQIQEYVNLNIKVGNARAVAADYSEVDATVVQPHEDDLPITFLLERRGDAWLVYDVRVEGVSMVENYRAQFDRVIREQGLPALMNDLRQKRQGLIDLIGQ
jgi:phospholipid transport system substrate-binding protein